MSTCHIWEGAKGGGGYGRVWVNGKVEQVHRHAYTQYHRLTLEDIKGVVIRHTCDNPLCANPLHLLAGTHADNVRDMHERGRQNDLRGERNGIAKLTEASVRAIRRDPRVYRVIAADYGVSKSLVGMIKCRESWKHVDPGTQPELRGNVRGKRHGGAKLTEADVCAIRADTRTQCAIAADYGVSQSRVGAIKRGECWKHITEEKQP
jgi:hypothetical protein